MSAEEASRIAQAVQRMKRSKRAIQIALPTAAALGAGAAVAVGSIPGGDGTITGCYASAKGPKGEPVNVLVNDVSEAPGTLRVIDPSLPVSPAGGPPNVARECQQGESTISWNEKGPQGLPGQTGPQGSPGGQGAPGSPLIGGTTFGVSGGGNTFLKLDGIKGESTDKIHKGEIEIDGFSLSAQGSIQASGGGGGAGKTTIQSFQITKKLDKASPLLFQAVATGKHIKDAVLSFTRKAGGKEQTYLKFEFQGILISGVQDGASDKAAAAEQVSFAFQKCKETFYDSKGKAGPAISVNVGNTLKL
jgi:type VI secretion system secreted protein Hcp